MRSYSISQRKKSRGNHTWYGRTFEDGVLVSEVSLKTKRKSDAMDWLNMMNAARFMPDEMRKRLEPSDRSFDDAIRKFMSSIEAKGDGERTLMAYRSRLSVFEKWIVSEKVQTFRSFNPERASEFTSYLSERYAPKTHREVMRCVSQLCAWASRIYGLEGYDPFRDIAPPKMAKKSKEFWTPEQIDDILDNAPDRDFRLFWSLMAFAGLRHAEACAFGPSSVSYCKIRVVGKGDKEAFLPIGERLAKEIRSYRDSGGNLEDGMFMKAKFRHSDRSNDTLRNAVRRAGLDPIGCTNHKFRHSFASNLLRANIPVPSTARLMRHSSATTTLSTYSHLLQEDLKDAVDVL